MRFAHHANSHRPAYSMKNLKKQTDHDYTLFIYFYLDVTYFYLDVFDLLETVVTMIMESRKSLCCCVVHNSDHACPGIF